MSRFVEYGESPNEQRLSLLYGRAARLLSSRSKRREDTLKAMHARLWPAVRLGQITFVYDSWGAPTGFATWAFLTEQVSSALTEQNDLHLDISEWNEGDQLWVMDFFAPYGNADVLCKRLKILHARMTRARAVRVYTDGRPSRLIDLSL